MPGEEPGRSNRWAPQLTYLAYRSLGEILARVPEPVAFGAAGIFATVLAKMPTKAAATSARHQVRICGGFSSRREQRRSVERSFRSYARYWVEGARLARTSAEVVLDRMVVESGWEHLVENMASGRGVIMALPHTGSWEWGGAFLAIKGYPMTSVAEPLEPPQLYRWFVAQREAMGLTIHPLGSAGPALVRALHEGRLVGLLCDRDIEGRGVEVELFGEKTTMPAGPAALGLRTGAAVLPTAVYSGPGVSHTAVILPAVPCERRGTLRDDVARVTQDIASALEQLIRRAPEQWHVLQPNWPSDPGGRLAKDRMAGGP